VAHTGHLAVDCLQHDTTPQQLLPDLQQASVV
jgi:hypothetical protein